MPPIPDPLGEGEETAVYSSDFEKVMGEKAAIVCHWRVGAGSLSLRTLCSAQAPACPGGGGCWLSAWPLVLRGNKILSNQKMILRPFSARTSIKVPRRIVRRL